MLTTMSSLKIHRRAVHTTDLTRHGHTHSTSEGSQTSKEVQTQTESVCVLNIQRVHPDDDAFQEEKNDTPISNMYEDISEASPHDPVLPDSHSDTTDDEDDDLDASPPLNDATTDDKDDNLDASSPPNNEKDMDEQDIVDTLLGAVEMHNELHFGEVSLEDERNAFDELEEMFEGF